MKVYAFCQGIFTPRIFKSRFTKTEASLCACYAFLLWYSVISKGYKLSQVFDIKAVEKMAAYSRQ